MNRKKIGKITAVVLAILLWQIISMVVGSEMLLASPLVVVRRLSQLIFEKDFLSTVIFSIVRMAEGFLLAFSVGIVFAVLASRFRFVETLLFPYVVTIKTVPVASFIILCLVWFSYTTITVFISFLIAFPVIYLNVLNGIKNVDSKMKEMAELFHIPWKRKLLYIEIPSVKPYLLSACNIAVGMAWKSGIAAEVIGNVDNSIGERLYDAKIYFQNADLLSWTVVIIILSVVMEKLFMFLLKKFFVFIEKYN